MTSDRAPTEQPSPSVRALIAIPTCNNRESLRDVVEQAMETGLPVLVVDDGSTDGSLDTIEGLAVESVVFPTNRGKGAAIRAAGEWAAQRGFTHVITVDADGQHLAREAERFLPAMARDPLAIVVGRRDFDTENVTRAARFGRWWSNMWLRVACGAACHDSQSGFRAYPVAVLDQVKCFGRHYDFEVEILARAVWAGAELESVDVSVRYFAGEKRASRFRAIVDNARISRAYTCLVARNLRPWPHNVLFNPDPDPIELSWGHPIRFWKSVYRRMFRKVGDEKKLSLRHPIKSLRLLHLERSTPREITLAAMLGVYLGALPFIG